MKKRNRVFLFFLIFLILWLQTPLTVCAKEKEGEDYQGSMLEELDFSGLDQFTGAQLEQITFSDLVNRFLSDGMDGISSEDIAGWIKSALLSEINANRRQLIEIVLLAFCFSVFKNFAGSFHSGYVISLCFFLVYCVLALMLLNTFATMQQIVADALQKSVDFMKMLIPTFCISMIFSSNISSSATFYQAAFLIIYLIEWLFLNVLMPLVHIYVLMEILNHFLEEERFGNLTKLFGDMIGWGIKLAGACVLGLNVVQNLISPAKDRFTQGTIGQITSVIPGVGNAVSGIGELLLGAGIVVKNCVGAAGLVMLLVIGLMPLLKVACLAFFYRLAAAVTEPVTDKRIAGCLRGMSEGALLYVKLLGYCLVLFFLTIALTTAATSFVY